MLGIEGILTTKRPADGNDMSGKAVASDAPLLGQLLHGRTPASCLRGGTPDMRCKSHIAVKHGSDRWQL